MPGAQGSAVMRAGQAGGRHVRSMQKRRAKIGWNRGGNLSLTGLKQGFPGFFVALVPLGIAQGAKGRLDCADRMDCLLADTSMTTTNKGNQP
jgi:hypothetical protein